jgi:hypothetical protein
VATAYGGIGGAGRVRVSINSMSSRVAQLQSQFGMRVGFNNISPDPGIGAMSFFEYPTP